ncbi:Glycine reductase complex component B subunit gamma [subsurface metagenome]
MTKEIERVGIPTVHMCSIVPISLTVGANRIVPTIAIPYPMGNPELPLNKEKELRKDLLKKALTTLQTKIEKQTIFR